jgi:hypothetical protein
MLALSYGVHGITFFSFDSYDYGNFVVYGLIDININHTDLSNLLRYDLVPRLKGNLGKTLMMLNYTGKFISLNDHNITAPDKNEVEYLKIQNSDKDYFWHAGLFDHKDFPDDKYFLLTNLRTTKSSSTEITIKNYTKFKNIGFTDIEGGIDTTIGYKSLVIINETLPPGEGRLYHVAPVIKYGGKLLYNEKTEDGMRLNNELIIDNDAKLIIQGNYYANADIIVRKGKISYKENGKIHFSNNKKLIIKNTR